MNSVRITIDDLKIDDDVKLYFKECITRKTYNHILFYGNPGTGKTTSVDAIINEYKRDVLTNEVSNICHHEDIKNELSLCTLRLNASVYRNTSEFLKTVMKFINSKPIYYKNIRRFLILDEIDYMTPQGQQCLSNILSVTNIICFSMCNYMNRLCDGLLSHFFIINYNSFTHIIKTLNDETKQDIYKKIINRATNIYDIREYCKEIKRCGIISEKDIDVVHKEIIKINTIIKDIVVKRDLDPHSVYNKWRDVFEASFITSISIVSSLLGISKNRIVYYTMFNAIKD